MKGIAGKLIAGTLALFGLFVLGRLAWSAYHYSSLEDAIHSIKEERPIAGSADPSPIAFAQQPSGSGFFTRTSTLWLTFDGSSEEFQSRSAALLASLSEAQASIAYQKENSSSQHPYLALKATLASNSAETLLQNFRSQYAVVQFEQNRQDLSSEFQSLQRRQIGLKETGLRISATPEQFKLGATQDLNQELAEVESRLERFEAARINPPQEQINVVLMQKPGLGLAALSGLFVDALWWALALIATLAGLALAAYLTLRLFRAGRDLIAWIEARLANS
ncbi:MAG: hypothetical protein KDK33_00285 [Leptospiraceae bacterium]|nr:hypothetical protein [Leptospiraceae bacterium]